MARPKHIVGLDLGTHAVKVARIDGQSGSLISLQSFPIPLPEPEPVSDDETTQVRPPPTPEEAAEEPESEPQERGALAWVTVLADLFDDEDQKAIIVTNAPSGMVASIHVDVPFADRLKVQSVIPHLLSDELPIDERKAVYDFYAYDRSDESGAEAVVGFAKADDLQSFLEYLQSHAIDPAMITLPALTIGNFVETTESGLTAIVDIGHSTSNIVVVDGNRPVLARSNRAAGKKITEMLATRFNRPFAEAEQIKHQYAAIVDSDPGNEEMRVMSETIREGLRPVVRDIRRSLQGLYANSGREVSTIYVCGGTSNVKNIEKHLSAELGVPVRRLSVNELTPEQSLTGMMSFALARNYNNDRARSRSVNLRQGPFVYTGSGSPRRRMLIRFGLVLLAIFIVLGGIFYLEKLGHEARRDAMQKELAIVSKKVFGEKVMSSSDVKKRFAGEDDSSEQFVPKVSAYQLMYDVVNQISKDVELDVKRLEIDLTRNVIQLVAKTTDAQAVDKVVSDLREVECFKKVTPGKTKVKNESAEFDVQISSGCS